MDVGHVGTTWLQFRELSPIVHQHHALIQGGHEHHMDAANAATAFPFQPMASKEITLDSEAVFLQQMRSSLMVTMHESQKRSG